jgi:O-acetylserine/cysteine efflux transporter
MNIRDILLAVFVTAIWGFNFVVIKWGVAEVPPLLLTGLRFAAAALPAVFFVRRPSAAMAYVAGYGFVLGVVKFGLLFVAMHIGFSASLSSLVLQLQAFFTMGFAALVLHDRPKPVQVAGALLAFAGIGLIATTRWSSQALLPMLLAVVAAAAWGVANIVVKKSGEKDMLSFIVWSSLFSPLPLFALSWLFEDHVAATNALLHPSWKTVGSVLFLAWVATLVGFSIWNNLLSRYPAGTVAPFSLLVPVFGIASGVVVMGDAFSGLVIWGAALVFAGLILNVFGPKFLAQRRLQA